MAAMAACADWAIHGPFGQFREWQREPSTMSCITNGAGCEGCDDILRANRGVRREAEGRKR